MKNIDYKNMSNSEINIELMNLENEYESIKTKVRDCIKKMEELDKLYNDGKIELSNRKKGIVR